MDGNLDPTEDRYSAIHEAGHAVAAVLLDQGLRSVSIGLERLPNGKTVSGKFDCGTFNATAIAHGDEDAKPLIMLHLAGPFAEGRINPTMPAPSIDNGDYRTATIAAGLATGGLVSPGPGQPSRYTIDEAKRDAFYVEAAKATVIFIEKHWAEIEVVADALQVRRTMTGREVADLVAAKTAPA